MGAILCVYPSASLQVASSFQKELFTMRSAILQFADMITEAPESFYHMDNQVLSRLWGRKPFPDDFTACLVDTITPYLDKTMIVWTSRDHRIMQMVDSISSWSLRAICPLGLLLTWRFAARTRVWVSKPSLFITPSGVWFWLRVLTTVVAAVGRFS